MTAVLETRDLYRAEFDRTARPAFAKLRRAAIDRFTSVGFPTGREEAWRFTDVTAVAETPFTTAPVDADTSGLAGFARGPLRECQLAFVNGRMLPMPCTPRKGLILESLATVMSSRPAELEPHLARLASIDHNPFTALNTAFMGDGAFVRIERGTAIEPPVHLLHISAAAGGPFMSHPRHVIVVEPGARVTLVESWLGPSGGKYLTNAVTEIRVGEGAAVDYYKVQRESPEAFHFASIQVHLARSGTFTSHAISLGAAISRNDLGAVLDGEGAECTLNGLYETAGRQLADNHTVIDHAKPHGTSRELYKGVLGGRSRAVFDGRIIVRPAAQKTNAVQNNRNLLLSKEALVNTKPQLEIFANDVRCKHGATVGQLDSDVLFYLRSRGIGMEEARRLLVQAFAGEILDQVKIEAVRQQLGGCLFLLASSGAEGAGHP